MKPRPRQPDLFDTADIFALALITIPDPATDHADRLATQARAADLTRRTQDLFPQHAGNHWTLTTPSLISHPTSHV
jgi:hypothetical protein